ncbi:glutamate synthase large subunit [Staphylococcus canis]|uniref:Glutamate synthase large subunit n=1 Tax=Staphylococcus canis TaxID=2724942 RepID=A0ABS0T8E6_9STAP|nr:glutamate synthase large subunit [Staphylococcus canis]MBI5975010.1 glutamate synthase large subunit [Staphylococcus canis]
MSKNLTDHPLGLYREAEEHDACGIGFYANMNNERSHHIVEQSLEMLRRLDHRGGIGADGITGDGAGIMTEIPYAYLNRVTDFDLPTEGAYAVGMLFSNSAITDTEHEAQIATIFSQEGLTIEGYRDVPVDTQCLAAHVAETMPNIQQMFVTNQNAHHFDRALYLARKQVEQYSDNHDLGLYFASLSRRTIVYKGWLRSDQIYSLYLDLQQEDYVSKFGSVHSRFSTNTFPSWERAHPNRLLMHNGEINTIQGNANWMRARQKQLIETIFPDDVHKIEHIINPSGSDSAMIDNAMEFLSLAMAPEEAAMLLVPEPWLYNPNNHPSVRAFYEFYSYLMEPWDGPTMISFCDGDKLGALTDRNGLRPGRYTITKQNEIIFSSEVGVVDVPESEVAYKGQLNPGKLLLVDFNQHKVIDNDELKTTIAEKHPYESWLAQDALKLDLEAVSYHAPAVSPSELLSYQQRFGYTREEIDKYLTELVTAQKDPIGAMGYDAPLAVLSTEPESLFQYFKQLFAEVTNPPIDAYREKIVTSELAYLGKEGNLLKPSPQALKRVQLKHPILTMQQLDFIESKALTCARFSTGYTESLATALEQLGERVLRAVEDGAEVIVLEDQSVLTSDNQFAMPILLAVSHIHQLLIRNDLRMHTSLVAVSGETREVHHIACLIGYGANAVVPYLAQHTIAQLTEEGRLHGTVHDNVTTYNETLAEGLIKVMAKMGISTVQSYHGAQIFEAVGIGEAVIEQYFEGTTSKLSGLTLEMIDAENKARQSKNQDTLDAGSTFQWRQQGQYHTFNPTTIRLLQHACRENDYTQFKAFSDVANTHTTSHIRDLFEFEETTAIDIAEVEPVEAIVKRFKTGAMSYGSISQEAHQTLAEAMNKIGGKSNSGEGGEALERYDIDDSGRDFHSAIKQVASGRFGVTSHYLNHATEIQIKVAQGAKPGEGGQLPGGKVYPWIAEVRGSTPGIGLISPPPHHDIYSIEDLAQLIHDLKNVNHHADITVKLVSKSGVGTIAAGVAKAYADKIVISGYDGGTGASPKTSIQHAGLPWELGLAETHQTLMMNGLRSRVRLETDGKLLTGRDIAFACMLGAEEFGFATAPLVVLGCVMMRVCHKDTCPVGIATQNGELRQLFTGKAQHVVNYMHFVAQELREIMAQLGVRSVDELVGRTDLLKQAQSMKNHPKAQTMNLDRLLHRHEGERFKTIEQQHGIEEGLDATTIVPQVRRAIEKEGKFAKSYTIHNVQRNVGVVTGSTITRMRGLEGLNEDSITLTTNGHAGQSLGAFIPKGLTIHHTGDANDYVGKGLSGGKIIVNAPNEDRESEIIVGNVCFYGATKGEAYINGRAGERFCIRNSGAHVVVEGVGDHGLEYMTGGRVVILGDVGKNFGQGMSGGECYIFPSQKEAFLAQCQLNTLDFDDVTDEEQRIVRSMIEQHVATTQSLKGRHILENFETAIQNCIKVIPKDYKVMRQRINDYQAQLGSQEAAVLAAFNDHTQVQS